ncbi:MAG TPA: hypothetical protein VHJ18_06855 [Streptosporangiaceae bacterium]|jgi:hypothetical protein|nr:hypothetical protein [Streptosporangiaceae bacterium]
MTEQPMPEEIQACAFFLADHAVVENGKLYVNGGFWNQVYSAEFPVVRAFALAAVLHIPWRKHHHGHAFAVTFEDADGRPLTARFEGQFRVGTSPSMRVGDFTVMPVAAFVTNFVLDHPADYAALLAVNDVELARWRFRAIQAHDPATGTQAGAGAAPPPEEL